MIRDKQHQRERHLSALSRRLSYLTKRRDELGSANSYDLAEIAALAWALEIIKENGEKNERNFQTRD